MNTDNLDKELKLQQFDFDPFFHSRVMARLENQESESLWNTGAFRILIPAFASVLICMAWVLMQDGALTLDTVLGVDQAADQNIIDYLMYL